MSDIKRIPLSTPSMSDPWLDFEDDEVWDMLRHLRSDNLAFGRLRDALLADVETAPVGAFAHS